MADDPLKVIHTIIDALNNGDADAAIECVAPDAVDHAPVPGQAPGLEGWKAKWEMLWQGFPDIKFTIDQSVADDDTVATRYTVRATHTGEFLGMPPTGKSLEVLSLDMIRVRDGKVVDHWGLFDSMAMMAQLGMMPPPS